jgi:transposase
MHTTLSPALDGRSRRRRHSAEFKTALVAACKQPGISIASVALSHQINANLLRRWMVEEGQRQPSGQASDCAMPAVAAGEPHAGFVAVGVTPGPSPAADIRIELRRGATTMAITWPAAAGAHCAAWMREMLR